MTTSIIWCNESDAGNEQFNSLVGMTVISKFIKTVESFI